MRAPRWSRSSTPAWGRDRTDEPIEQGFVASHLRSRGDRCASRDADRPGHGRLAASGAGLVIRPGGLSRTSPRELLGGADPQVQRGDPNRTLDREAVLSPRESSGNVPHVAGCGSSAELREIPNWPHADQLRTFRCAYAPSRPGVPDPDPHVALAHCPGRGRRGLFRSWPRAPTRAGCRSVGPRPPERSGSPSAAGGSTSDVFFGRTPPSPGTVRFGSPSGTRGFANDPAATSWRRPLGSMPATPRAAPSFGPRRVSATTSGSSTGGRRPSSGACSAGTVTRAMSSDATCAARRSPARPA